MTEWSEPEQELGDALFGRGIYARPEAPELGLLSRVAPFLPAPAVGTALLAALAISDESVRLITLFRLGQRLRVTTASVQDDPRLRGLREADRDALGGREPPPPPPIPGVPDDRLHQLLELSEEFEWGAPVDVVIRIYIAVGEPRDYDILDWLHDRFAERGWDPDLTTLPMASPARKTAADRDRDTPDYDSYDPGHSYVDFEYAEEPAYVYAEEPAYSEGASSPGLPSRLAVRGSGSTVGSGRRASHHQTEVTNVSVVTMAPRARLAGRGGGCPANA